MTTKNLLSVVLTVLIALGLTACKRPSPKELRLKQHLPPAGFVADVIQGENIYLANCARCHGLNGAGSRQGPPLVHKIYRPGHHADLSFHRAVKSGVRQHHWKFGAMPAVPKVSPEDTGHIVAYIRKQQRAAGIK